jgi:hypothetical protein
MPAWSNERLLSLARTLKSHLLHVFRYASDDTCNKPGMV